MNHRHTSRKHAPAFFAALILVLLPAGFGRATWAQEFEDLPHPTGSLPQYGFERITIEDGLPENSARALHRDRLGYLWIATQNGLVRYDGINMRVYRPDETAPVQFLNFDTVTEDAAGDIWAGAVFDGGLLRLDRRSQKFTYFQSDPSNPHTLSGNTIFLVREIAPGRLLLWSSHVVDEVGVQCLDRLDTSTGQVRRIRIGENGRMSTAGGCFSPLASGPDTILRDSRGQVWVATAAGLLQYDPGADSLALHNAPALVRYEPSTLAAIDSARSRGHTLAAILQPGRDADRTQIFTLTRETRVLVFGMGEMTHQKTLDAGWIEDERGRRVWAMTRSQSAWAGGEVRNRMEAAVLTLGRGRYRLRYRSDRGHSPREGWAVLAPDRPHLWGVQIVALPPGDDLSIESVPTDEASLPADRVTAVFEDRTGTLWIGTAGDGLFLRNSETGQFSRFVPAEIDIAEWNDLSIHTFMQDEAGRLWIGTNGAGLFRIDDVDDGAVRNFTMSGGDSRYNTIQQIVEDVDEKLWLGTPSAGLIHFNPETGDARNYEPHPDDPHSLGSRHVRALMRDAQGTLWAGTWLGGLNKLDRRHSQFRHLRRMPGREAGLSDNRIGVIEEAPNGVVWVGTAAGLNRLETPAAESKRSFGRFSPEAEVSRILRDQPIHALAFDSTGGLWVGTPDGLLFLDAAGTVRAHYRHDPTDSTSLGDNRIADLLLDRRGRLWIATFGAGINRLEPGTETFIRYPYRRHARPGVSDSLDHGEVHVLYEDRGGTLWIGTDDGGVNRFDPETGIFASPGKSRCVTDIYEDRKGRLWACTCIQGLIRLDGETGAVVRRYGEEQGLASNSIGAIVEDEDGYLWLATGRGISRFDPEMETFRNFTRGDGLPFVRFGQASRTKSGVMLFGGLEGLVVFDPGALTPDPNPPQVALETLSRRGGGQENDVSLFGREQVDLAHHENDVTFRYTGLHFERPDAIRYAYRLEGYDGGWIDAGMQRTARYTSLRPGRYTFRVKAANVDGIWNEAGAAVALLILPPWWQTPWAYGLYGLLVMAGLFAVDRVQRRRLVRKERDAARERELEQAREIELAYHELREAKDRLVQQEKMASLGALTAGIAHEIKNPLNFINNFASVSKELTEELDAEIEAESPKTELRPFVADLRLNVTKIEEHGKRADGIVRSMLEHSRGSRGERAPTDVNALVEEYVNLAYHGMRAQVADFGAEIARDYDEHAAEVEMVPQEVGRVLLNLMSNAFQAVHEKAQGDTGDVSAGSPRSPESGYLPRVSVSTSRLDGQVKIRIQDNGPGIPEEIRQKVFEPFFTTKPTGQGTGLGLSLSYDIVTQGHGGKLDVESDGRTSTAFVISLPD